MKLFGWIVLLYALMNSYFGVAAVKNAVSPTNHLSSSQWFLAVLYGMSWLLYLAGGAGLVREKRWARWVVSSASAGSFVLLSSVLAASARYVDSHPHVFLFAVSRPVPDLFFLLGIFCFIPRDASALPEVAAGGDTTARNWRRTALFIIALGASVPWFAVLVARAIMPDDIPVIPHRKTMPVISVVMTAWSAIPFVCLALFQRMRLDGGGGDMPREVFRLRVAGLVGGLAGLVVSSMYVYILIWLQNFNSFLMAVSPPFVFTGAVVGTVLGIAAGQCYRKLSERFPV